MNLITEIFIELPDGTETRMRPQKIFLKSETEGTIVKDGRPVKKVGERWIYRAA